MTTQKKSGKMFATIMESDSPLRIHLRITNAMTNDERNAIHYLAEYNREELSRLYKRVKERMANNG
jgi:hypothetical protein